MGLRQSQREKLRYPEATAAWILLYSAVATGRLTRPDNCEACGEQGKIEGHQDDYSKPLDVRWLCPSCRRALHKELRK